MDERKLTVENIKPDKHDWIARWMPDNKNLKKDEQEYIQTKLENLEYINAQIQDEIEVGHEDDLAYWQEQYQKQSSRLDAYLKRKGISLKKPLPSKDKDNERAEVKEVHKKRCIVCRTKGMSRGRTRELERKLE